MIKQIRRASKKFISIECCHFIMIPGLEELANLTIVLEDIGLKYISYEIYDDDECGKHYIELRMAYSDSVRMEKRLNKRGYELKPCSNVGIVKVLQKIEEIEEL